MHLTGVYELRDLVKIENISVIDEYFSTYIQKLHEQVKSQLQKNNRKHKQRAYLRRREVKFETSDLALKEEEIPEKRIKHVETKENCSLHNLED